MRFHFISTLLFLVFFAGQITAQKSKFGKLLNKPIELVFDSTGKMVSFPSAVIRKNKTICFQVSVPKVFIANELRMFKEKLEATSKFLKDKSNTLPYYCYFRNTQDSKNSVDILEYIKMLDAAIGHLRIQSFTTWKKDLTATVKELNDDTNIPIKQFFLNLFQDQFEVQVFNKTGQLNSFKLNNVSLDKDDTCFYFSACKKVKDIACRNCGIKAPGELSLRLFRSDPYSQTVKDWFESHNTALDSIGVDAMDKALRGMAETKSVTDTAFSTFHGDFKPLKRWMADWLWFSGGKLILDPFQTLADDNIDAIKKEVKELATKINTLKDQKKFLDSVLVRIHFRIDKLDNFKKVQKILKLITERIAVLAKEKDKNEKILESKLRLNRQPKSFLNNVTVLVSAKGDIRPQSQLDASDDYYPVAKNKRQFHRVTEIPDNENGFLVIHNLDSTQVIKYDHRRVGFSDNEEFTEWVSEQLSIIEQSTVSSSILGNFESFIETFTKRGQESTGVTPGFTDSIETFCDRMSEDFKNPLYTEVRNLAKDYKNGKFTFYYTRSIFEEKEPATPLFHSYAERVKFKPESPFKDSIAIKKVIGDKETELTTTYVKVGKLRFIQMGAGLAVTEKPVTVTTVDTTTSGFRVSSTDNKARAIIAFKVYPFQSYKRDRWLIPRYPLRRLSVLAGFEMLHPLNNFYVGGCYDIVPGLGVSVGTNYYLKTRYKIENNVVTDTYRNYDSKGPYYSVVVNPVLFVQFVKLFFKAI